MLSHSREYPSTDHALRVLVRIDTQLGLACLEVRGCLTASTYPTLVNILAHTGALGAGVRVNLLKAEHVEPGALHNLRCGADAAVAAGAAGAAPAGGTGGPSGLREAVPVEILMPDTLPVCRLGSEPPATGPGGSLFPGTALTNEEAMERAFLQRDPRVLAERPGVRPGPGPLSP